MARKKQSAAAADDVEELEDEQADSAEAGGEEEDEELTPEEIYEHYKKAGEVHQQVMEELIPEVQPGESVYKLCRRAEKRIEELGAMVGFPANISINEVATHYTATPNDDLVIPEGAVVKVDLGVAVEGFVADGARTVSFCEEDRAKFLTTAVETAVKKAMSVIRPGVIINSLGAINERIVRKFGYQPVADLSGHQLEQYIVHGGKQIPNVKKPTSGGQMFEEGEYYALEVFATTGGGEIHAMGRPEIFSLDPFAPHVRLRNRKARQILGYLVSNFKTLPFSRRAVLAEFRAGAFGLRELVQSGKLIEHNPLRVERGELVAQFEHTFKVTEDGVEQIT